ncbi:MAG: hypothetical protein RLZ62_2011 [Bacteroidota bacterium]
MTPPCVSFSPRIRLKSTGPNSLIVARRRAPISPESVRNSTVLPVGFQLMPIFAALSMILGFSVPGMATPERSPLISMSRLGTPLPASCSAMACRVLVLPVPVAPAMSPCRFMVRRGTFICSPCTASASIMAPPSTMEEPEKLYPDCISAMNSSFLDMAMLDFIATKIMACSEIYRR